MRSAPDVAASGVLGGTLCADGGADATLEAGSLPGMAERGTGKPRTGQARGGVMGGGTAIVFPAPHFWEQ